MARQQDIIDSVQKLTFAASRRVNETVPAIIAERLREARDAPPAPLSLTECHVIDAIGSTEHIKASEVAQRTGLTRGGVSKIVARLETKGYILTSARSDNRKERDLSLTALGQQAFAIHQELHEAHLRRWESILGDYNANEVALLGDMLKRVLDEFAE